MASAPPIELQEGAVPRPRYQLFTDCPQDWFLVVVRGGDIHKIVHSVKGWRVNEEFEFVTEDATNKNLITPLRALTGYEFVGVPGFQGLKVIKFAWNKYWRTDENSPIYGVVAHDPQLVYVFPFESQYPLTYEGIDTVAQNRIKPEELSLVAVTFVVTVRVRMLRPRIALATNIDWFGGVLIPKLQGVLKDFAGEKSYDELIRGARKTVTQELEEFVMGTNQTPSKFREKILQTAGVDIIDFSLVDIKPNKAFEDAQNELASEQRKASGVIVTAEAAKQAKILEGEGLEAYEAAIGRGKATAIKAIREAAGSDSETYFKWDGMKSSKLGTYAEGTSKASILVGPDGRPI